jgi:hypothetical protein
MIKLNNIQSSMISGGNTIVSGDARSYPDQFWSSFVHAAGTGSGIIASPVVAVGMAAAAVVYYGVYTPVSCIVSGAYSVVSYPFRSN